MATITPSNARDHRLLFGPFAACVLIIAVAGLAEMLPAYSHVRQTVSEIGEYGSPARIPFAIALGVVALCILLFAVALRDFSLRRRSSLAAYFIACMALSIIGVGVFAHPHPLHNVFGLSELIGYQAPLVLAVTWRHASHSDRIVPLSWIAWVLIWIAIALNLSSVAGQSRLWAYVEPNYGLVQRMLFALWFGWCAAIGILLYRRRSDHGGRR